MYKWILNKRPGAYRGKSVYRNYIPTLDLNQYRLMSQKANENWIHEKIKIMSWGIFPVIKHSFQDELRDFPIIKYSFQVSER